MTGSAILLSSLAISERIVSLVTGMGTAQEQMHSGPAEVAKPPIYSADI